MAKIFLSFFNAIIDENNPRAMPCFYESFIKGLMSGGNKVLVYPVTRWDYGEGKCPVELLQNIKGFDPDLMILFNNRFYDISSEVDCPIVIYEVDSFLYYINKKVLRENPNRFYYLVPQTDSISVLRRELGVDNNHICYFPFFSEIKPEELPQTTNIVFIGSKFTQGIDSPFLDFMKSNPAQEDIKKFQECFEAIKINPFITNDELVQSFHITSPIMQSFLNVDKIIAYMSDIHRIQVLSDVSDLGLDLYGTRNWVTDLAYELWITTNYKNTLTYSLADNQRIYNSSKIGININHLQATSGFSWRVCDIMASNACLVSEYKPDFEKLFPGIPIPLFKDIHEARKLCQQILSDEEMRKDIVLQCQNIIDKQYRFKHLLSQMENFLGLNLHCSEVSVNKENGNQAIVIIHEPVVEPEPVRQSPLKHDVPILKKKAISFYPLVSFRRKLLKLIFGRTLINNILTIESLSQKLDVVINNNANAMQNIAVVQTKLSKLDDIDSKVSAVDTRLSAVDTRLFNLENVPEKLKNLEQGQFKAIYDRVTEKLDTRSSEIINTNENSDILVTVFIPVYNKGKTLARTLESVLMQKTDFPYSILIIDDGSTDNSLDIIKIYAEAYPDIITFEVNDANKGLLETALEGYNRIQTKYWAVLDGDDFWLAEDKMQKAVDFLESHPDFTLFGSNTLIKENNVLSPMHSFANMNFDFDDENVIGVHTSAAFFRNAFDKTDLKHITQYFGTPFAQSFRADSFRNFYALSKGRGHYESSIDSVYNITNTGIWTQLDKNHQNLLNLRFYYTMIDYFNQPQHGKFMKMVRYYCDLLLSNIEQLSEEECVEVKMVADKLERVYGEMADNAEVS
jgi:glycosyltransferase involved in cell wall biosynthesis